MRPIERALRGHGYEVLNLRYESRRADIATLELEVANDGDSQPKWRLYRVNEPVKQS